jgi:hypothetical protein
VIAPFPATSHQSVHRYPTTTRTASTPKNVSTRTALRGPKNKSRLDGRRLDCRATSVPTQIKKSATAACIRCSSFGFNLSDIDSAVQQHQQLKRQRQRCMHPQQSSSKPAVAAVRSVLLRLLALKIRAAALQSAPNNKYANVGHFLQLRRSVCCRKCRGAGAVRRSYGHQTNITDFRGQWRLKTTLAHLRYALSTR